MLASRQILLALVASIVLSDASRTKSLAPANRDTPCWRGFRHMIRKMLAAPPTPVENAKVTIIGSGNWGTAVAKIVAENVQRPETSFDSTVRMYVFDEKIKDAEGTEHMLSEYINEHHENIKYLKGVQLPHNLVAEPDLLKAVEDADVLVWLAPHQFVLQQAEKVRDVIKETAASVSLIKGGFDIEGTRPKLLTDQLKEVLGGNRGDVSVLMGANLANEVGEGKFAEATLGCRGPRPAGQVPCEQLQAMFNGPLFRVDHSTDIEAIEISGALKNVVALAAGFSDGVNMGNNAKAAIVRHGLLEIEAFVRHFYPRTCIQTFFESAGVADLVTTCYGGRNRKCAEAYAKSYAAGKPESWADIESRLLNGQKLQGTLTVEELFPIIRENHLEEMMPLHVAVHAVAFEGRAPETIFDALRLV
eukprot:TRINITY_DN5472_c0_g1_i2.p1 TRINITY_DN5472_c0_g1~~TRINITY_DN5472_c0_g1_i2.p1  ORF type:complete len:435 (+),score=109.43 TRINITY_DN5472_c0_g1_i2:53-1306(+)